VVDRNVSREPGADVAAFDQIVRQQGVLRKPTMRRGFVRGNVVDALPSEAALAEQILIYVGDSGRIRVDTWMTRVDRRETRAMRARQRDPDARLHDAESTHDATALRVILRAVQRVRQRADEERGVSRGKHGVRVERDDVSHALNCITVADDDG